jgi:hypothetical protein
VPYKLRNDSRGRFSTSNPPTTLIRDLSRREKEGEPPTLEKHNHACNNSQIKSTMIQRDHLLILIRRKDSKILTKPLAKGMFEAFRDRLGLVHNSFLAKREC